MTTQPHPTRRGQIVRVIAGPDAGKRAVIIQEPFIHSSLQTIQFYDGRAVVVPESILTFIYEESPNDHQ